MQRPCPAPGCGLVADVLDSYAWIDLRGRRVVHYELECPSGLHYYPGWTEHEEIA